MTHRMHRYGKRDNNEVFIRAALKRRGIDYIQQGPGAGCDLILQTNPVQYWEIKNLDAGDCRLEDSELKLMERCLKVGLRYEVVATHESIESAEMVVKSVLEVAGASRSPKHLTIL